MDPLVIAVAPTGARRSKADHPGIPIAPAEIAADTSACVVAGARVLHLHVRDAAGAHTIAADAYAPALAAVRGAVGDGVLVQVTTEAVERFTRGEQMALVRMLRPEAVSLAVRELIPDADAEAEATEFLAWATGAGIGLQFIVYAEADVVRLVDLVQRGIVPASPHALLVLGRYRAGLRAEPRDLPPLLAVWPDAWPWTVCAFGPLEQQCLADAIALGGHVRVGFENNLLRPDGTVAASNAEQVAGIRAVAERGGRPLASVTQAKALYGSRAARAGS